MSNARPTNVGQREGGVACICRHAAISDSVSQGGRRGGPGR
jgi:hypothetical protein